jgi:hypothetical protein
VGWNHRHNCELSAVTGKQEAWRRPRARRFFYRPASGSSRKSADRYGNAVKQKMEMEMEMHSQASLYEIHGIVVRRQGRSRRIVRLLRQAEGPPPPASQSRRSADRPERHTYTAQGPVARMVERTSVIQRGLPRRPSFEVRASSQTTCAAKTVAPARTVGLPPLPDYRGAWPANASSRQRMISSPPIGLLR